MCCSARKTRKRMKQGRMWPVGTHPREKSRDCRTTCRGCLKFHVNFFLNLSGCSAVDMFAEKLSVQPALLLDIGSTEAAAVCPELSWAKMGSALHTLQRPGASFCVTVRSPVWTHKWLSMLSFFHLFWGYSYKWRYLSVGGIPSECKRENETNESK